MSEQASNTTGAGAGQWSGHTAVHRPERTCLLLRELLVLRAGSRWSRASRGSASVSHPFTCVEDDGCILSYD